MAIDIDHEFWEAVQAVAALAPHVEYDRVLAQALRLIQWAEARYREGKVIRRSEYDARGFIPEFIGIHMEEIEPGCLMYMHADDKFAWIMQKKTAGRKGGIKSGESRRVNSCIENVQTSDFNGLDRSGAKRDEAARTPSLYPLSLESKDSLKNIAGDEVQQELLPAEHQWLIDLWNELRGPMPALQKITKGTARYKHVVARLKVNPDPATWRNIFSRMEKSDFVSGRSGQWAGGGFDWVIESAANVEKVLNGNYNPEQREVKQEKWEDKAKRVMAAVAKYGDGDPKVREFLGEELWNIALRSDGGFYAIRRMPSQPWALSKLAGLLKESASKLQQGAK